MDAFRLFVSQWQIALLVAGLGLGYWLWAVRGTLYGLVMARLADRAMARKDYDRAFAIATRLVRGHGFPWVGDNNEEWRLVKAAAYCLRGSIYTRRGEDGIAAAEYDWAIELAPDLEEAYLRQAAAYRKIGHWSRIEDALANCDAVLEVFPELPQPYLSRAIVWALAGYYDEALADCEEGLALAPDSGPILRQAGLMQICARRYANATETLARAVAIAPRNGYGVLLLHIARVGAEEDDADEFRVNAARIDGAAWPGPLVALYQGELTPEQAFAAARQVEGAARERRGEVAFYLGERALLAGEAAVAERLLKEAAEACPAPFIECWAATAELHRLQRPAEADCAPPPYCEICGAPDLRAAGTG